MTAPPQQIQSPAITVDASARARTAGGHGYRAGDGVVVRTPLLPVTDLIAWADAGDSDAQRNHLLHLLARPEVDEAIFLASPGLHGAIAQWRAAPGHGANQGIEHALVKYVARMAGRPTPFGLFSAVSAGTLGRRTSIHLAPRGEYRRRTRLDNDYLFALAAALASSPPVRDRLPHRSNTSIYRAAGQIRYAAARLDEKTRSYHLVSVEPTAYLESTLARAAGGARLAELAAALVDEVPEVTFEEARVYLDELVEAQLLVPALGVAVTGPEPIDGLIAQLAAADAREPACVLTGIGHAMAAIDAAGLGHRSVSYNAIVADLAALPLAAERAALFQVDMVKPAVATIGTRVANDVARAIDALATIVRRANRDSLDEFRRAFRERYEDRVMPLGVALDEDSGIGFEAVRAPGIEGSPLLAGLRFPGAVGAGRVSWGRFERHMVRRLAIALRDGSDEIALDDADLRAMKLAAPARLPDAFSAMVRLEGSADELARGELTILFEGTSGPSGARLLGRFCHAAPEIEAIVRAHHAAEESLRPEAIFAEIAHLNEGRLGNVLCRPVLRDHEIVFLGMSGASEDRQLTIDDLLVAVRGERIVLFSRRLDREIVPRLTTAHNYRVRSLGVYRFLCGLAQQEGEHVGWSWGALGDAPFLPRVRLGRVVLSRATWNLADEDLAGITAAVRAVAAASKGSSPASLADLRAGVQRAVGELRARHRLPRFIALAEGDNELPVDLDNVLLAAAFADEVAGAIRVSLCEFFPSPDRSIVHGPEGAFSNEVVLTFVRDRGGAVRTAATPSAAPTPRLPARRQFAPGSEWLFAKVYVGEGTGDRVLRDAVAPVVRDALAAGDARQWFFVRYADPEPHLRIRFAGDPTRLVTRVLPALEAALAPLLRAGAARRLQLDTYERELERYGGAAGIELVEQLFWRDSEAVLAIVELLDGDAGADARWRLALRGIEGLLTALGLDDAARAAVVGRGRDVLGAEFQTDGRFWSPVGKRFVRERADLEALFAPASDRDADHALAPGLALLAARDARLAPIAAELRRRDEAGELSPRVADFAWSLAHMHANRLLHASQRAQELVLYDLLRRLHASRRARASGRGRR